MDHTEVYEDTWQSQRHIWETYLKMDIIYARLLKYAG